MEKKSKQTDINRQKEIAKSLLEIGTADDVIEVITKLSKNDVEQLKLEQKVISRNFAIDKKDQGLYN